MSRSSPSSPSPVSHQMIQGILERGQLAPKEYLMLTSALISNMQLTPEMRQDISRVLDALQMGRLQLVDS
ncbi:hypothetical protein [Roseofilum casamattae]|uniref:Uncharacterized protein n=1 Tax=Roseofilum casamattae BLCC-M143 TaxID=3022442 RepID=A0ABT7BS60_9CYAN|nr:hypothetical protein [Roseofilum casamattae]MDJ1182024.1 hypothetical protein [Roseofilum casamattae BLCC-M143]